MPSQWLAMISWSLLRELADKRKQAISIKYSRNSHKPSVWLIDWKSGTIESNFFKSSLEWMQLFWMCKKSYQDLSKAIWTLSSVVLGQHHSQDANGLPWELSSKLAPRLAFFQNNPSGEILNPPRDWRNRLSGRGKAETAICF